MLTELLETDRNHLLSNQEKPTNTPHFRKIKRDPTDIKYQAITNRYENCVKKKQNRFS